MKVLVVGAGVAGLCCALELAQAGYRVELIDRAVGPESAGCSRFAGGMLAPYCEGENAHQLVTSLGVESVEWWQKVLPEVDDGYRQLGSLVLAQGRDRGELARFAQRSSGHESVRGDALSEIEPELAGIFPQGLYFAAEAHIDPRLAMRRIRSRLQELGATVRYGADASEYKGAAELVVDCRGLAGRDTLSELRGVKGEMLLVKCPAIRLSRPIRLLHPRIPLYIVPRGDGVYMIGATMIESDEQKRVSARSLVELLQGAFALHPTFSEAEILELGTEVRPAFRDNLPKVCRKGNTIFVNGLYRHGFLLAPVLAQWVRNWVSGGELPPGPDNWEIMNEDSMQ
ncbi:MAG: glycine oxidase ThiO [Kofleriaceae bacterium]|nr:glycine oxidase ThiO [Kofleriaceae bacterium]